MDGLYARNHMLVVRKAFLSSVLGTFSSQLLCHLRFLRKRIPRHWHRHRCFLLPFNYLHANLVFVEQVDASTKAFPWLYFQFLPA